MQLLALGAVLAAGLLSVQTRPDFSGTWTLVGSDAPEAAAGVKPTVVILTQTATTLTLKNGALTLVFPLDGSERTIKGSGPNAREVTLQGRWDGARLLIEQRTETTSINTTVSLSADGNELTIDAVAKGPQGEHREKQVFKKS